MKNLHLIDAGKFAEFLEKEIAAGRNPTTPEQWADLIQRMEAEGLAKPLGEVGDAMDGELLGAELRESGLRVKTMRFDKKEDKPNA